ncbi:hypothetical protein BDN70DRAFT_507094 [Pholiota conissans]|uniref:Uncharacterized protein n=1 Tax=Pholiota conissans TaxID=109636 RepID=A0A9P6D2U1_9AGAR|nr:hypothetical protein BDN70DRAFT_507094 [Pholiota conissans]
MQQMQMQQAQVQAQIQAQSQAQAQAQAQQQRVADDNAQQQNSTSEPSSQQQQQQQPGGQRTESPGAIMQAPTPAGTEEDAGGSVNGAGSSSASASVGAGVGEVETKAESAVAEDDTTPEAQGDGSRMAETTTTITEAEGTVEGQGVPAPATESATMAMAMSPPPPLPLPLHFPMMNGIGSPVGMMSPVLGAPPMGMMSPVIGSMPMPPMNMNMGMGMAMGMGAYSAPSTPTYFPYAMSPPPPLPPQQQHPFVLAQQMHYMQQQQFHQQQQQQHAQQQQQQQHGHGHAHQHPGHGLASPQGAPSAHQANMFAMLFPTPAPPPMGTTYNGASSNAPGTSSAGSLSPDLTGSPSPSGTARGGKRRARSARHAQQGRTGAALPSVAARPGWEEVGDGWMGVGVRAGMMGVEGGVIEEEVIGMGRRSRSRGEGEEEGEPLLFGAGGGGGGSGGDDEYDDDLESEGGFNELLADAILKRPSSIGVRTRSKRSKITADMFSANSSVININTTSTSASASSGSGSSSAKEAVEQGSFMEFTFPSLSDLGNVYYRTSRSESRSEGSSAVASPPASYLVPNAAVVEAVVEETPASAVVGDEQEGLPPLEEKAEEVAGVSVSVSLDDVDSLPPKPSSQGEEGGDEENVFALRIPASVSDPVLPLRKGASEPATPLKNPVEFLASVVVEPETVDARVAPVGP